MVSPRMLLLILAYPAVILTILWYAKAEGDVYKLKLASLIFWGATVMFFVDKLIAYLREGESIISTSAEEAILGFTLALLGLGLWMTALLITDPKGIFKKK